MSDPKDELTRKGASKLAEFLLECLKIGWKRESMDFLESLWLRGHDRNGNLKPLEPPPAAVTGRA